MEKINTFICPIIRTDLVDRMLYTLYANTPDNFYVIIIDQSEKGVQDTPHLREMRIVYKNLTVVRTPLTDTHPTGNLGFAMATNLGVQLARTKYVTFVNDDVEFIHPGWWQGVMDTFDQVAEQTPERPAILVNPASIKLPDWSVGRPKGDDHYILPYKTEYEDRDWHYLLEEDHYVNEHLTIKPNSVIDGVTMYCSVVDREKFLEVGPLDEKFYPGGGEDYDYACRLSLHGYRGVGTTKSWVFHHWSKSFSTIQEQGQAKALVVDERRWNNNNEKWGEGFDIWGDKTKTIDDIPPNADIPL